MDTRLKSLDLLKSLAIIGVVFYHYDNLAINFLAAPDWQNFGNYFLKTALATAVPLFFLINGGLLLNKKLNLAKHWRKLITVIILTALWAIITLAALMPILHQYFSLPEFIHNLLTMKLGWINHLWFFQTLAVIYLLFPLLKIAFDRYHKIFTVSFWLIFAITFGNVLIVNLANVFAYLAGAQPLPEVINYFNKYNGIGGWYPYALVYFMLGGWLLKNQEKFKTHAWNIAALISLPILMAVNWAYGVMMSQANHNLFDVVWRGHDMLPTLGLTVALFILTLNYQGKFYKLIKIIGANSLGIYLIHRLPGSALLPYFQTLSHSGNILTNILFALTVTAISLFAVLGLKKIPLVKRLFSI